MDAPKMLTSTQSETGKEDETPSTPINTITKMNGEMSADHALGNLIGEALAEYQNGNGSTDLYENAEKDEGVRISTPILGIQELLPTTAAITFTQENGEVNGEGLDTIPESPATIVHAPSPSRTPAPPTITVEAEPNHSSTPTPTPGRSVALQLSEATHFILTSLDYVSKRLQGVEARVEGIEGKIAGAERERDVVESIGVRGETAFCVPFERNLRFIGREEEIRNLMGRWKRGERGRIGVVGLGGIGKTELILHFIYTIKTISPTTPFFWFRPQDLLTASHTPSIAAAGTQLDEWIKASYSSDCVLVVDTGSSTQHLLQHPELLARLSEFAGTLVVVARNSYDIHLLVGLHGVFEVPQLGMDAAKEVLQRQLDSRAKGGATNELLGEACRSLCCNPRALGQIARTINQTGLRIQQFLDLYQLSTANKLRLFNTLPPVLTAPSNSDSIIGKGIFDVDAFKNRFPEESKMLFQFYYLGGNAIPKDIFSEMDALSMIITLHILHQYHLITEDTTEQALALQPLVYLTISSYLGNNDAKSGLVILTWQDETIVLFARHYPNEKVKERKWWRQTFMHLISTTDIPRGLHTNELKTAVASIYHHEATFHTLHGSYISALEQAVLAKNTLPDPTPLGMTHIPQSHAELLEKLARFKELSTALEKILKNTEMEKGSSIWIWQQRITARLFTHLSPSNNYSASWDIYTSPDLVNSSRYEEATRYADLASILMLRGQYLSAESEAKKALEKRKKALGDEHESTLESAHQVAEILFLAGKPGEALTVVSGVIESRENVLGGKHPDTISSLALKGKILLDLAITQNDLDVARTILSESETALELVLGTHHPAVLSVRHDLAISLLRKGAYTTATHSHSEVLKAHLESWGVDEKNTHSHPNPDILASRVSITELVFLKDGPIAAETLITPLLDTAQGIWGSDHVSVLRIRVLQARILSALEKHEEACVVIEGAVRSFTSTLGAGHPSTYLATSYKAGILLASASRQDTSSTRPSSPNPQANNTTISLVKENEITSLASKAYTEIATLYGGDHFLALTAATNLALSVSHSLSCTARLECWAGSVESLRRIYTSYSRSLGSTHPETLQAQWRLAEALGKKALFTAGGTGAGAAAEEEEKSEGEETILEEAKKNWREALTGLGSSSWIALRAWREWEGWIEELEARGRCVAAGVEDDENGGAGLDVDGVDGVDGDAAAAAAADAAALDDDAAAENENEINPTSTSTTKRTDSSPPEPATKPVESMESISNPEPQQHHHQQQDQQYQQQHHPSWKPPSSNELKPWEGGDTTTTTTTTAAGTGRSESILTRTNTSTSEKGNSNSNSNSRKREKDKPRKQERKEMDRESVLK